jgi:hypothetical protein
MSGDCDSPGANIMKQQRPAKYTVQMHQAILDSQHCSAFLEEPLIFESVADAILLENEEKQFQSR